MSHANIKDPETGLWNCWSTCIDDYLFDEWLPEDKYRAELAIMTLCDMMKKESEDYDSDDYPHNLVSYTINGKECTITVKHLNKIIIKEPRWLDKEECDATKAFRAMCNNCDHENCDECDNGDNFHEG